jgi:phytoene dehydrogenase-like protein
MSTAIVVGSGPNGLAAAVALARGGLDVTVLEAQDTIGGGTRTAELTVPGVLHDICSATHPLAIGSPFLQTLDLERHGLEWCWPDIDLAHPLDDGRAGVLRHSIADTIAGMSESDGRAWRRAFGRHSAQFDKLTADILRPVVHLPRHPLLLATFGLRALAPASWVVRRFSDETTRGLFGGMAAHVFRPLTRPTTASVGLALGLSAHRYGWPVARGGSRSITDALAADLLEHGGRIETGRRIGSLDEINADVVMLDLAPRGVLELAGDRLPARIARAYRRYRYGPAVFKLDLAVDGGVPWTNEACRRAGSVHLGGSFEQVAAAEAEMAAGRMPERPFVLVGQQYLADPSRSAGDVHPIWAYAHVPHGYEGDATDAVLAQFERFAPGTRERVVGQVAHGPAWYETYNPNFVGGDISAGANDAVQILLRPRVAVDPYRTGIPGVYICSAATPPGGGVHGMCGANAAASALRQLAR